MVIILYDNLTINDEPYISMNGEIICDEYLDENNPVNPESPFGLFIYLVIGGAFDRMDEMTNQFLNDCDVMSSSHESLDRFWGASLNLPRPTITENGVDRLLTDDEYRVYLYVCKSQLLTRLDLMSVFGHCMGDESLDDEYNGVTVTDELNEQFTAVDHLHYNSPDDDPSTNIGRVSSSDENYIVDHESSDDDVYRIPGQTSYTGEFITYVNVPSKGWSQAFLDFMVDYASIKGNVLIREVTV